MENLHYRIAFCLFIVLASLEHLSFNRRQIFMHEYIVFIPAPQVSFCRKSVLSLLNRVVFRL